MSGAHVHTFLFTDIVGSSRQWEADPEQMQRVIEAHHRIVREFVERHHGHIFKSLGDGQAAVFGSASDAITAAMSAQATLRETLGACLVKMAIHSGEAEPVEGDYMGASVNRVARITDLALPGQVLVSELALTLATDVHQGRWATRAVEHVTLEGHRKPERIHILLGEGLVEVPSERLHAASHHSNLPVLQAEMVGRVDEMQQARQMLQSSRLVNIIGFGGIGKTTLALNLAHAQLEEGTGSVWWVDCEALGSQEELHAALGRALGLDGASPTFEHALQEELEGRSTLVVLDCCERLASNGVGPDILARQGERIRVLATSRVVFGHPAEAVLELGPLGQGARRHQVQDSLDLFVKSAKRVAPEFALSRTLRPQLVRLLDLLEHVPLAILIAASRVRHMTLSEIIQHVEASRLSAIRTPSLRPSRHGGLRQVIDSSFELLDPRDRELAAGLSVFGPSFAFQDAVTLLGGGDSWATEDGLIRLRDASLLQAEPNFSSTRYRTLDSVREYLREVLPTETQTDLRRRLSKVMMRSAQEISEQFVAQTDRWTFELLGKEVPNFRSALEFCDEATLLDYGRLLALPLLEGAYPLFEDLCSAAMPIAEVKEPILWRRLKGYEGIWHRRHGRDDEAKSCFLAKAQRCEKDGDSEGHLDSLGDLLALLVDTADEPGVRRTLPSFVDLAKDAVGEDAMGYRLMEARCWIFLGEVDRGRAVLDGVWTEAGMTSSNWRFFALRTLSELYRLAGEARPSLTAGSRLLDHGLNGGFDHFAGQGLLELAESSLTFGIPELCLAAHAAARMRGERYRQVSRRGVALAQDLRTAPLPPDLAGCSWRDLAVVVSDLARERILT